MFAVHDRRDIRDVGTISGNQRPLRVLGLIGFIRGGGVVLGICGIGGIGRIVFFGRLDGVRNIAAAQILLAGDVADYAGNSDLRIDISSGSGISKIVQFRDDFRGDVVIHGDDAVNAGGRGMFVGFGQARVEYLCGGSFLGRVVGHGLPIILGGVAVQCT